MTIEHRSGDLFSTDVEALVNTVNCNGVMGRGIALEFKKRYPKNFQAYREACIRDEVQPGKMFVFELPSTYHQPALSSMATELETEQPPEPRYIINFPTKRHWRGKSRMEDIDSGLEALRQEIVDRNIKSIAIPALGCGLGGLKWDDVRPRIAEMLAKIGDGDIDAVILEPGGYAG